jgi:hypothetical protein
MQRETVCASFCSVAVDRDGVADVLRVAACQDYRHRHTLGQGVIKDQPVTAHETVHRQHQATELVGPMRIRACHIDQQIRPETT